MIDLCNEHTLHDRTARPPVQFSVTPAFCPGLAQSSS